MIYGNVFSWWISRGIPRHPKLEGEANWYIVLSQASCLQLTSPTSRTIRRHLMQYGYLCFNWLYMNPLVRRFSAYTLE